MDDNALDIILRLQDELSPALAKAQKALRDAAGDATNTGRSGTKAFKEFEDGSHALKNVLGEVAASLGLVWSIEGAVEFVKAIAEEASQLNRLSQQTQINVEDLQVLAGAAKEFGIEGDQLGRAMFALGQKIAGGDTSVSNAYHLMGMSIDDVKGKNALDLFLTTERGLGTLAGSIRDTAAADLYGGKLGSSMGAFAAGADETVEKVRRLNTIASKESVTALAEYQDSIDRVTRSVHAWFIEIEGKSVQGLGVLTGAVEKGASKYDVFFAVLQDGMNTLLRSGQHVDGLASLLDKLNQASDKDVTLTKEVAKVHAAAVVALDAHGQAAKFMASLELDAAKPLLVWQEDYLQHLKDIGQLDAKHAAGIGVSADQLAKYTKQQDDFNTSTEAMYAETLKYDELLKSMDKDTFSLAMEHEKQWRDERLATTGRVNAALLAEFDAQTKLNAAWGLNAAGAIRLQDSALQTLTDKLDLLHIQKVDGISQAKEEQVLIDEYTKALFDEATALDTVTGATVKQADATQSATDKFNSFKNTLVLGVKDLDALNADLIKFYDTFLNNIGTFAGPSGIGTPMGNSAGMPRVPGMPIQTRDAGGPVIAGQPYYIGRGAQPELFIPQSAGTMVPSGASGSITNHFYVNGAIQDLVRPLMEEITKSMRRDRMLPSYQ